MEELSIATTKCQLALTGDATPDSRHAEHSSPWRPGGGSFDVRYLTARAAWPIHGRER